MKNNFETHGIDHLSASSTNLASDSFALWAMRYLFNFREPTNAPMARGHAVEHGIYKGLSDEFCEPEMEALTEFNRKTALGVNGDARAKEAENIPLMVEQGLIALGGLTPTGYQQKIKIELDDVPVPIIGYTDLNFDKDGHTDDIKSTTRMPSAIPAGHRRQGAIYQKALGNQAIRFVYVTPKKNAVYTLEDCGRDLEQVRQTAIRLNNFLGLSNDIEELASLVIPNFDTFYFNTPATREKAREIYGY